jgi:hypothetical protein
MVIGAIIAKNGKAELEWTNHSPGQPPHAMWKLAQEHAQEHAQELAQELAQEHAQDHARDHAQELMTVSGCFARQTNV